MTFAYVREIHYIDITLNLGQAETCFTLYYKMGDLIPNVPEDILKNPIEGVLLYKSVRRPFLTL